MFTEYRWRDELVDELGAYIMLILTIIHQSVRNDSYEILSPIFGF